MVDSIKHNLRQVITPVSQDAKSPASRSSVAAPGATPDASFASDVSELSVKNQVAALSSKPPIDSEAVSRIKQAIADGKYPINLDLVSERLMESYLEMKG